MSEVETATAIDANGSSGSSETSAKTWLRALEMTAPIARNRERIFPSVIQEMAERMGSAPALLSDRESLTYRELSERINQYSRWALDQKLAKGDVVCLLMANRPEYMAIWLGLTGVGVVVSLLNTNLVGGSLAHCINAVWPKCILVAGELVDTLAAALADVQGSPSLWVSGDAGPEFRRIDLDLALYAGTALSQDDRRVVTIDDLALYIYTSGTTGLPKAAKVSHARVMQWTHWFAAMMDVQPIDRMYNCLPMYHSVGGVQAPGAVLVAGGAVVIREKFSASQFWSDVLRWDCTLFQYIGELCRYLLHTAPSAPETEHRIRLACGNGLSAEVWEAFQDRFRIPRILEFYAATEGSIALFNVPGRRGAIGQVPKYLEHRFSPVLVKFDVETAEPSRDEQGHCIRCAPNEAGEALGKMMNNSSNVAVRFEGYADEAASENRILRDVFERGDAWIRTGDLMRKDEKGFFYFVDRVGDTFRWKGENVATAEVARTIAAFPGILHANVYGVAVPGTEGRAGMAAVAVERQLDLAGLRAHLASRLPMYARPRFLRIRSGADLTGTLKYSKTELIRQGYDPLASTEELYFDHAESQMFIPLDKKLYEWIQSGEAGL